MLSAAASAARQNGVPASDEFWLLCLPLNHIGGASVILRSWIYGNPVIDARNSGYEAMAAQLAYNHSLTFASLVPTQLFRLLQMNPKPVHSGMRQVLLGGGPSSVSLVQRALEGSVPLVKSYGMTETCAQIASVPASETGDFPPESSGRLFEPNRLEIRNGQGVKLPAGQTGLLWLKGPQVIRGYVYNETGQNFFDRDGWFCTGDYARVDTEGRLYIEMRRSDLIVSGGENVNPREIEEFIEHSIPGVKEAAVAGVPDDEWGQRVVAFIAGNEQMPDSDKILRLLKKELTGAKMPREIRIVDKLPRNPMGKLLRSELGRRNS
jgi:O-succinylbenzoic acid--CoA ligase